MRLRNPGGANANAEGNNKVSSWTENLDGTLTTAKPGADLLLPQRLPDKFEIELMLRSSKPYSFSMVFGRNGKTGLRSRNVGRCVSGSKWSSIRQTERHQRRRAVRAFARLCKLHGELITVYSNSGEKLREFAFAGIERNTNGLTFRCLNNDLTIEAPSHQSLGRIAPEFRAGKETRVHLSDGKIHQGIVESLDDASGTLRMHRQTMQSLKSP